jgi:hypothetical protein
MLISAIFGFLTFATQPSELPSRLSILVALYLTCYAIQWVTIERLPRLPFNTVLDDVTSGCVFSLLLIAIGQSVSFQLGLKDVDFAAGDGYEDFDFKLARLCDTAVCAATLVYVVGYCLGYQFLYHVWYVYKSVSVNRRWIDGSAMRNKNFRPTEAWRLKTTQEWVAKHRSYLGIGEQVANLESF